MGLPTIVRLRFAVNHSLLSDTAFLTQESSIAHGPWDEHEIDTINHRPRPSRLEDVANNNAPDPRHETTFAHVEDPHEQGAPVPFFPYSLDESHTAVVLSRLSSGPRTGIGSYRHQSSDSRLIYLLSLTRQLHTTTIQNTQSIAKVESEIEILLYQDNRHVTALT